MDFSGQVFVDKKGNVNDHCYPYYEGIYIIDPKWFFQELEIHFECMDDDEEEITEDYIDEMFPFLEEEEREEVINKYVNK
jgi:hypothetical protein